MTFEYLTADARQQNFAWLSLSGLDFEYLYELWA